ncbi:MAG: hypothetical protein GY925_16175 [Actinomycetia bacterium]|nr:hypothetical protein [Actinomycetes bacterium]
MRWFRFFRRGQPARRVGSGAQEPPQTPADSPTAGNDYVFPEDWRDLRGRTIQDETERAAMERELRREVAKGHVLRRVPAHAIARCHHCDDVLFSLTDGRFALVHLSWPHKGPDPLPWPRTEILDKWRDVTDYITSHDT